MSVAACRTHARALRAASRLRPLWLAAALAASSLATGCGGVKLAVANGADVLNDGYQRVADLAYGDEPRQRADVYLPRGTPAARRPLVVFFHGGRWSSGSKEEYRFVAAGLAERGSVVVVPNYRLYPTVRMGVAMADAARAVAWAQAVAPRYGADASDTVLMGHSSGAHFAALLATDRRWLERAGGRPVRSLIGLAGAYDFLPLTDADLIDYFDPPASYADSQPVNFVTSSSLPALLAHGLDDTTVKPRNTRSLAARLTSAGVPVAVHWLPGEDHAGVLKHFARPFRATDALFAAVLRFIAAPLAGAVAGASDASAQAPAQAPTAAAAPPAGATGPRRVVTIAPHLTELVYAAGAGDRLAGTLDSSDYPPAARRLPRVGDVNQLDAEQLLALRPDLVIAWGDGTPATQYALLERLHIPVLRLEQHALADVPASVEQLGRLFGTRAVAEPAAARMRAEIAALGARHREARRLRVFYQVWDAPLYTLGGAHVVSEMLRLCGAQNAFATESGSAFPVDAESVYARDPDVLVLAGSAAENRDWQARWQGRPRLRAIASGAVVTLDPDLVNRMGPRLVDGARQLCEALDAVRARPALRR